MDAASIQFVLFGLIAAVLSNLRNSPQWRALVLLIASGAFLFLLTRNPVLLVPLLAFVALGFVLVRLVGRWGYKVGAGAIVLFILAFMWLKKYTLLPASSFIHDPYLTLGMSYIFFRVLHLLIETGSRTESTPVIGPYSYALYTLNFTTFVSGPIQRYDDFARDQFAREPLSLDVGVVGEQLERIVRGFFKVNVLAMILDIARADAVAQLGQPWPLSVKLSAAFTLAVVYPFFLYANFSGYIDIVIGLARLMRVRLPENFDRPFSATSFIDFWNRWHITLSSWLKTYVYSPLLMGMMRRVSSMSLHPLLGVFSFFVTFFLVGIWHGRTSEFAVFGLLQGGGVALNKLWQLGLAGWMGKKPHKALTSNPVYAAFARGLTFSWFAFTLFWFWADWKQIDMIYRSLAPAHWLAVWAGVWLCATVVLAAWEWFRATFLAVGGSTHRVMESRYARVVFATAMGTLAFVLTTLLGQAAPGLVYKAF